MELQEAIKLIKENKDSKEVQELAKEFNPLANITKDNVGELVEKNDVLKSYRDQYFTKSLETWKENNLNKIVEEKVKERVPEESEEQKQIRELKEMVENERKARKRESLKNYVISELNNEELPLDPADYLIGEDEEQTKTIVEKYKEAIKKDRKKTSEQLLKQNGREPADTEGKEGTITKEQATKIAKENPEKFNKLFEEGKIKKL
jgi:membrane-bound lytic murein transglycosylase